jgi:hypothetical protein
VHLLVDAAQQARTRLGHLHQDDPLVPFGVPARDVPLSLQGAHESQGEGRGDVQPVGESADRELLALPDAVDLQQGLVLQRLEAGASWPPRR